MIHLKVFENFDEVEIYINDIFEDLKDIGYSFRINKWDKSNSFKREYSVTIFKPYLQSSNINIGIVKDYILTLESYMNSINYRLDETFINYINHRNPTILVTTNAKEYPEPAKHVLDRLEIIAKDSINSIILKFCE